MADARAKGQSTDEALASTDDAVAQDQMANISTDESEAKAELRLLRDFENSIEAGFQMATFQGPLCAEPVVGMGWIVENVTFNKDAEDNESESITNSPVDQVLKATEDGRDLADARLRSREELGGCRCPYILSPGLVSGRYARLVPTYQAGYVHL